MEDFPALCSKDKTSHLHPLWTNRQPIMNAVHLPDPVIAMQRAKALQIRRVVRDSALKHIIQHGTRCIIRMNTDPIILKNMKKLEISAIFDMKITHTDKYTITWNMPYYRRHFFKAVLTDRVYWLEQLHEQLPSMVSNILERGFIHTDIAFRNIMIDDKDILHFIDYDAICPLDDLDFKQRDSIFTSLIYDLGKKDGAKLISNLITHGYKVVHNT